LNEEAARRIGYKDPIGKRLTFWEKKGTIVGVIRNFHFNSLHDPIRPLIIRFRRAGGYGNALIRTKAGKTPEVLKGLEKLCRSLNPKFPVYLYVCR
jgi:putative ABC transport system permease protein